MLFNILILSLFCCTKWLKLLFAFSTNFNLRILSGKTSQKNLTLCKNFNEILIEFNNVVRYDEVLHHLIAPKIAEPIIPALLPNFALSITILL